MIIDVNKLKAQGKTEETFEFLYMPQRQLLDLPGAEISGGVNVKVTVFLSGRSASVEGKAEYLITGECSRCLSPATANVLQDFYAEYGTSPEDEYPIKSGLIDLTAPVEEAVILGAPIVIYCKEDCKGFCPVCGCNLNDSKCNCKN